MDLARIGMKRYGMIYGRYKFVWTPVQQICIGRETSQSDIIADAECFIE
jgi:hypothetical protein